ncbi:MAG: MarR family winged helix-turn-helix transcriptional regulator [Clostridium sp.]|uniref:MarR family winged helix-turn-helix transcriptional regulator n=1 Tax=Clostridium sp. TaxID=1506 RepID=UPI002671F615|nr:MarR family winged helix-turn-helix transcriptional regulator [Clostridium sp.]MCI7031247.1 MarR family winged helix-turn-helix transcriptional regulator [Clostridium sp.]MDD7681524.1 MarR family winged helix-turn-helix transcriptional regulator [Clostridium sp.]MDY2579391.1 MarR family winged helix-turn-helix transcriptional regulator [Clostridium sp.]
MTNNSCQSVGKYISIIHRTGSSFLSKEFSKFNIGSGQYMYLIHLYKNDGLSQEELTEILNIDKGTTAKSIKKLETEGFVMRVKDKNDKRINRVYLTPKALEIKDEFLSSINAWENTLTSNLSYAEKEQALTLLKKITYNITHK